jgi:N-methylhydantoinase A
LDSSAKQARKQVLKDENSMSISLAVDIGGSFTDVALLRDGLIYSAKAVTTTHAPDVGVIRAIDEVLQKTGLEYGQIDRFILGTTLATNALIERKGPRTALIATDGFTDIVEMARESRYAQYDVRMRRAEPLIGRNLRFGLRERINHHGEVVVTLDDIACRELASRLKALEIASVAVCLLHSYVNDRHEKRIRDILLEECPGLSISLSSEICPEIREYERTSTVCANAYVQPIIEKALDSLDASLTSRGLLCQFFLMTSSGALCSADLGKRQPVRLVESGPAGGAIFATRVARQCGLARVIEFDMGGTTAKVSYIHEYEPAESRTFEFGRAYRFLKGSGQPIRIPVIEMVEIGAGGGSIAHLDPMGRLRVGPESAVSDPGPVCFGLGGTEPTVTDSNCVLNYLDPVGFASGKITLQPDAAAAAMEQHLSRPLDLANAAEAAAMVSEVVTENMASAARVHGIELGHDIGDFAAVAIGGGGPLHVGRIADKLRVRTIVIPTEASVGSAIGFLVAPVQYNVVRSKPAALDRLDLTDLQALLTDMKREARAEVEAILPGAAADVVLSIGAYMRYKGQGYEIKVALRDMPVTEDFRTHAIEAFSRAYGRLYHRTIAHLGVEVATWFVTATSLPADDLDIFPARDADDRRVNFSRPRDIYIADACGELRWHTVQDYIRTTLQPGFRFEGPAVVSERHTTTVVPTGFSGSVDKHLYLILEKN